MSNFIKNASPIIQRRNNIMWNVRMFNACAHVSRPEEIDLTKSGGKNELLSLPEEGISLEDVLFPTIPIEISESPNTRADCHEQGIVHLTSHVLLFNDDMHLFLQMREPSRIHSGGKLSQSVGGHVDFESHSPFTGAIREAGEEAGIDIREGLEEIARYSYSSVGGKNREFVSLFLAQVGGQKVVPGRDEVYWLRPFNLNDVYFLLRECPELFSSSFKEDLKWLMLAWKDRENSTSQLLKIIQNLSEDQVPS